MATVVTYSNHYKYQLMKKALDISTDTIKVLLMRNGFVFNKDDHATLKNLKGDTTPMALNIVAATRKVTRAAGSFVTDGFVPGNKVTLSGFTNAGNNVVKIIESVTALEVVLTDGTGLVDETGGGDERMIADDELATGFGYTQNTKTTGAVTLTEDDTVDKGVATYPTVTWNAAGGDIGPTPGAILFDDTSADDTIIHYIDFGGNQTATDGNPFNIASGNIKTA